MPRMLMQEASPEVHQGFIKIAGVIRRGPLDHRTQELVKIRASQLNGCAYCVDQHTRDARANGEEERRVHHLTVWRESPLFTDAERAALGYAEAATRREPVSDELWETLRKHYPERELGDLVGLVALINALNLFGVPLHMRPPAEV
ncbi:carboxymuconolactone decarboxylase family protein [Actinomadura darangshiensis]|uniref:Carboxymuconolactone decarboxylase family protein n=1 Tax=Actinomadura darangshiensis TaxID=705336 RepID=A0A4R5BBA6_9ACTN|nr:carboxymuconolactone decarboxylase family protein [Actinomadura darangshiensis]TDD82429.1 carboxymuconolactone decarboxylase family protein [Actinomadura darangshiensis]